MNPFEFVLLILLIVFIYKLMELFLRNRWGAAPENPEPSEEVTSRLAELEERIQVLERIVTDDRNDLKRQFRDLGAGD